MESLARKQASHLDPSGQVHGLPDLPPLLHGLSDPGQHRSARPVDQDRFHVPLLVRDGRVDLVLGPPSGPSDQPWGQRRPVMGQVPLGGPGPIVHCRTQRGLLCGLSGN